MSCGLAAHLALLALAACRGTDVSTRAPQPAPPRHYELFVPADARPGMPLVLVLHGNTRNGEHVRWLTQFDRVAAREHVVVAYPDGVGNGWNDGRPPLDNGVDDVGFLLGIVDELETKYAIDRARVYVAGISNGGIMSLRLACEHPEKFAAVAAVTANIPANLRCEPRVPVSLVIINGTEDPLMPYDGGTVGGMHRDRGAVLGTAMSIDVFARAGGCERALTVDEPDTDPADGTRARRTSYSCRTGLDVELLTILGGGHTWPGGPQYAPLAVIGRVSRDFDATERIWQFFAAHPRNPGIPAQPR